MNPQEIQQTVQQAVNGNWFPLSIVIALSGVVIWMVVRNNDKKHSTTDAILKQLADIQASHEKLLERHNVEIDHLKKQA
jgi:hypothetical protein